MNHRPPAVSMPMIAFNPGLSKAPHDLRSARQNACSSSEHNCHSAGIGAKLLGSVTVHLRLPFCRVFDFARLRDSFLHGALLGLRQLAFSG